MNLNKYIKSHILSKLVKEQDRKVGIEVECFIYTKNYKRLNVNSLNEYDAINLFKELETNSNKDDIGSFSLEPGGQVEWSSPAFSNIHDLNNSLQKYKNLIDEILNKHDLINLYIGVDPFNNPESIDLINQKKYQLMNESMERNGTLGKWMMRNTSSIQLNYDIINERDANEIAFILDCLHPISAYLFSYSPYQLEQPVNEKNLRNYIWENTDNYRCKSLLDHGIVYPSALLEEYINYIKTVPLIFELDKNLKPERTKYQTVGDQLLDKYMTKELRKEDIEAALHQIFTNVRFKSLIEIRDIDCLPFKYILSPVAFFSGIIFDENNRKAMLDEFSKWDINERKLWNKSSLILDLNQDGPNGKSYYDWVVWAAELSIEGLRNRGQGEEIYFLEYFSNIIDNGPLTLQSQNMFLKSKESLQKFIFS